VFIDSNAVYLGWTQSIVDERFKIIIPDNYVNFFVIANFRHNSIDASTMTTNKSSNWVYASNGTGNCDLRTHTSFAGNSFDLHCATFHFWHFGTEKPFNKFWATTRYYQLRAAESALYIF